MFCLYSRCLKVAASKAMLDCQANVLGMKIYRWTGFYRQHWVLDHWMEFLRLTGLPSKNHSKMLINTNYNSFDICVFF